MTSSYRDPNVTAALAYQAEQEQRRKAQEQPSFIDVAGRTALGLGVAALAGAGIARGLRRNAVRPISVEDLGAAEKGVRTSARYTTRATATPPPSRPAPPAGVVKQQAAEEFTRQARAERPAGVQQISIQDLGPTFRTPSSAENKATLAFLEDVVLPTEQALTRPRLPAASFSPADYLTQKGYVEAAATGTPYSASEVAQLSRRPLVDAADRLLEDTDLLKRVEAEEAALVNVQPEIRGEQSRQQAQVRRALSAQADEVIAGIRSEPVGSLVATQQARTGFNVDQAINALDAAEDQQTGRVKTQLQRNEDLDMGQVEMLEDRASQQPNLTMAEDGPINSVASQLPDGRPVDQAEGIDLRTGERFAIRQGNREFAPRSTLGTTGLVPGQKILLEQEPQSVAGTSATRFMEAERDRISRELTIDEVPVSPARVDAELAKRLGPQASTYGPKYTARAQALQTFANTGDPIAAETVKRFGLRPVTFETFENMSPEKKRLFESSAPMSLEGYPSTELQAVIDPTGIKVNAPGFGVVDISTLRKPVVMESTARQADEFVEGAKADKLNWVQGKINEIEGAKQGILLERKERIKTAADNLLVNLEQAKANGQNDVADELESQLDNLRTLYKNPELVGDYKEFGEGGMRHLNSQLRGVQISTNKQISALEKRYPTTLANRTGEASRVFGELDVNTGEFIPETMEVRSGRSDVDLGRKGGGGRNIAEFTAGERLDEEIRALQGGGRMRDYDLETGAPVQRWQGDSTQTGRTIDEYGIRLTGQRAADPKIRPSIPQYTQQEIEKEALRLSKADPYGDVPMAPEYTEVVESLGYQQPTSERRASVLLSEQVRKGQRSFPQQNISSYPSSILARPVRINFPEQTIKPSPVQLSLPSDVVPATAAAARVRITPADQAAQQLEAYMGKLQRGRTSPLTSQVRIQPSLF
jgi:hypothetical protein